MKRRLILHIGAHKTGTTAIQGFLNRSENSLASAGWELVKINGVVNLSNTIEFRRGGNGRAQFNFHPHMLDMIAGSLGDNGRDMIISSEDMFFLNDTASLPGLSEVVRSLGFKVTIVVYLRNQVEMAASNKAQGAKTSQSALVFGNDKRNVLPELTADTLEYLSYHQKLSHWKTHFPDAEFIVRNYNRHLLAGGDSVTDFIQACGLPFKPDGTQLNESIGSKLTNLLHDLRFHGLPPNVAWSLFRRGFFTDDGGLKQSPSAQQAAAFMAAFEEDNRKTARDFGVDLTLDCSNFPNEEVLQPDDQAFIFQNIASALNNLHQSVAPRSIDTIRDSAIALEDTDLKQAHALMQVAHALRPNGRKIQEKLKSYEEKLGL
ncbi:hypothetical protein [Leisingera daeponensis]|uniref:hypothetical protein n=1 Tax=Leisingera daeponensis TaxID=405746 RepID=UPI001C98D9A7|nr:hypothetical protein [Leisingera daeponensis]MBY6059154.1 hypothetical protein [Leisingera daeponensis]